jgi:hypothetical protein
VGIVLKSFRHITEGVEQLLDPTTFAELRKNAGAYTNHALLETPQFLDTILQRHRSSLDGTATRVGVNGADEPDTAAAAPNATSYIT